MFNGMSREEERVINFLKIVRTMKVEQAYEINKHKNEKTAKHAVTSLFKQQRVFFSPKKRDYIMINPRFKPDKRMTDVIWLLLDQINTIDIEQMYEPGEPSLVGYVRKKNAYEIIVINDSTEYEELIPALVNRVSDNTKYVFLVYNDSVVDNFPLEFPHDYVFAKANYIQGTEILDRPIFEYFTLEEE